MAEKKTAALRLVIVDDEELARGVLKEMLADHADIEIVAECSDGFQAVKAVGELSPDLVLLDVQMPKLDGFDVLELLGPDVPVIFVTAYDQYAIKAFEVHAVDYLLKPFGPERLAEALDRARTRTASQPPAPVREVVAAAQKHAAPLARILIRDGTQVHVVPVEKIDYFESQDDYVAIHVGERSFLKEQALTELEGLLDPARFVRIHRRYLLNVTRLSKIELSVSDSRVAVLNGGQEIPISRSGYARLRELL